MALLIKKDTWLIILRTKHQVAPQPSLSNANHKDNGKAWAFGFKKEKDKHIKIKITSEENTAPHSILQTTSPTNGFIVCQSSIFEMFCLYDTNQVCIDFSLVSPLHSAYWGLQPISILQEHITFWGMPDFQSLHIWMHEDYTGWNHCIPHKKVVDNIAHI